MLVEYDLLAARPAEVMKLIYGFLGEAAYSHDFDHVEYDAAAFDQGLGLQGLHRVHPKMAPRERQTVLPPDLFERYSKLAFWRDMPKSKDYRIVAQGGEAQQTAMSAPTQKLDGAN